MSTPVRANLRVAVGQAVPVLGDLAAGVAAAERLVRQAASQGATLVLLGEAFFTGYDPTAFEGELPDVNDLDGAWSAPLRAACAGTGVTLLVCSPVRRGDVRTLSMLMIDRTGAISAPYDKQFVDRSELAWFAPGALGPVVVEIGGWRCGLAICYDSRFPEHAAAAAAAGADVYVVATAYLEGSTRGREVALPARALDNGLYVVCAASLGSCGPLPITGGSVILDPEGHRLAGLADAPGLAAATLDGELLEQVRSRQTMHADRRPDMG